MTEILSKACTACLHYVDHCRKHVEERGVGMSVFMFHPKDDTGSNCDYFFHKKESPGWNVFKQWIPPSFDEKEHIVVIVCVPKEEGKQCRAMILKKEDPIVVEEEVIVKNSDEVATTSIEDVD